MGIPQTPNAGSVRGTIKIVVSYSCHCVIFRELRFSEFLSSDILNPQLSSGVRMTTRDVDGSARRSAAEIPVHNHEEGKL